MKFNVRNTKLAKYFDFDSEGFDSVDYGDIVAINDYGQYACVDWDSYNYKNPFIADCEYQSVEHALKDVIKYYIHMYKTTGQQFKFVGFEQTDDQIKFCVKFD